MANLKHNPVLHIQVAGKVKIIISCSGVWPERTFVKLVLRRAIMYRKSIYLISFILKGKFTLANVFLQLAPLIYFIVVLLYLRKNKI